MHLTKGTSQMHKMILAAASAVAVIAISTLPAVAAPISEFSSQISVGPDGVRIGEGHRRWESSRREGRGECARLRRACVNKERRGQEGEGNCRRYRRVCG